MGNLHTSQVNFRMKCLSSTRDFPNTPNTGENANRNISLGRTDELNLGRRSVEDLTITQPLSSCPKDDAVRGSQGRVSFRKISRVIANFSKKSSKSGNLTPRIDLNQSDTSRSSGRLMIHPYARPKSLAILQYSTNDASVRSLSRSYDPTWPLEIGRPIISAVPEAELTRSSSHLADTSGNLKTEDVVGTLGRLRSLPSGSIAFGHRSDSVYPSKMQSRRSRLSKTGTSPSLDSSTLTATTMTCTLLHSSSTKAFPFFLHGTAYLLSDEQHRVVEQSLRSTKLLLHRLKRIITENRGHLHSFAEQVESGTPVYYSVYENTIPPATPLDTFEENPDFSGNTLDSSSSLAAFKEPSNINEAILEIHRLREENNQLRDELAKREAYIQNFLQKLSNGHDLAP